MDKEEFKKQIAKLQTAYKKKFTQEELILWFKEFKNVDSSEFQKAIEKTIKELKFIPKIADVRARIDVNPNDYYTDDPYTYLYKNNECGQFIK